MVAFSNHVLEPGPSHLENQIARSVTEAARGTEDVSSNILGVHQASVTTGAAATQILGAASGLAEQADALNAEVGDFIAGVKAA